MEKAAATRRPWRSWTVIALVLAALALAQACGQSGHRSTGPTTSAALQLKLRRVDAAQIPQGCTGSYDVTGPGVNIQDVPLPANGNISFQGQVGQTYMITVTLICPGGTFIGSVDITVPPGGATGEVVVIVSKVLGISCSPSTVSPGQQSVCTCDVQSAGGANITWSGVNATGPTANFSNQTPGTYTIACTINGVDTRSTTVTVQAPPPPPPPPAATGSVRVTNPRTACCDASATFSPPTIAPINNLRPGRSVLRNNVAPGSYTASGCSQTVPFQVQAGQTTNISIDGAGCG
jgi:hypothetical protein